MISRFTIIVEDDGGWDSGTPYEILDEIKAILAKPYYGKTKLLFACNSTKYGFTQNLLTHRSNIFGFVEETTEWGKLFKESKDGDH